MGRAYGQMVRGRKTLQGRHCPAFVLGVLPALWSPSLGTCRFLFPLSADGLHTQCLNSGLCRATGHTQCVSQTLSSSCVPLSG